ncbi:MAG: hypothetical protein AB7S80_00020 [Rhizobiaceae bacterium]
MMTNVIVAGLRTPTILIIVGILRLAGIVLAGVHAADRQDPAIPADAFGVFSMALSTGPAVLCPISGGA